MRGTEFFASGSFPLLASGTYAETLSSDRGFWAERHAIRNDEQRAEFFWELECLRHQHQLCRFQCCLVG